MTDFAQSNVIFSDFPFSEIRTPSGDYWPSVEAAEAAGFSRGQIWSVAECDGAWCYGPAHHVINVIGFIATAEHHDENTYYEESIEDDDEWTDVARQQY